MWCKSQRKETFKRNEVFRSLSLTVCETFVLFCFYFGLIDKGGYKALHDLVNSELGSGPHRANQIYNLLLKPLIKEMDEFKPSRSEEKWPELKWKQVWKNYKRIQCVSPVVKERAWLMRQDMLPGLKSRAFKHRNLNDPRDKLCDVKIDGYPCDIEETLIHFFC